MSIRDYLGIIWRRIWLVLVIMAVAAFAVWRLGQPGTVPTSYSGSSTLTLVQGEAPTSVLLYSYVATETSEIAERVANDLGPDYFGSDDLTTFEIVQSTVLVTAVPEIGTISLTVEGLETTEQVETVLEQYAGYITEYARTRQTAERDENLSELEQRQRALESEINSLQRRLDTLSALQTEEQRALGVSVDRVLETQQSAALSSLSTVLSEADTLRSRTDDALTPLRLVGPPTVVEQPGTTDPLGIVGRMIVGIGLATLLGVGLVISLNRFDTKIYNRREAEASFRLPVLAEVPKPSWRDRRRDPLISRLKPTHAAAEVYRTLRSAINHPATGVRPDRPLDVGIVVAVVSPGSSTGRSTAAANLAVAAAAADQRVLLVSADLRNPVLHWFFGVEAGIGLSDAIKESEGDTFDVENYTLRSDVPGLDLLLHGMEPSNPGEWLSHSGRVFNGARERYDMVIVDTPPMLVGNDVTELTPFADAMIVVARAGRSTIDEGRWMDETAARLQLPVIGVVLHGATSDLTRRGALANYGRASRKMQRRRDKADRRLVGRTADQLGVAAEGRPALVLASPIEIDLVHDAEPDRPAPIDGGDAATETIAAETVAGETTADDADAAREVDTNDSATEEFSAPYELSGAIVRSSFFGLGEMGSDGDVVDEGSDLADLGR